METTSTITTCLHTELCLIDIDDALAIRQELEPLSQNAPAITTRTDGTPVLLLDLQGYALPIGKALLMIDAEVADRRAAAAADSA
jgi:hypothetical protein